MPAVEAAESHLQTDGEVARLEDGRGYLGRGYLSGGMREALYGGCAEIGQTLQQT